MSTHVARAPTVPVVPAVRVEPPAAVLLLDVAAGDAVAIPLLVAHDAASVDYVVGGTRVEASDRAVAAGDGRFAAPIVRVGHVRDGWYFLADDGTVAVSETFLGRLRRVPHEGGVAVPRDGDHRILTTDATPPAPRGLGIVAMNGVGRIGFVDRAGRPYTATTLGDLHALAPPAPDALRDVVFADAAHGTAIFVTGRTMDTADGGATWQLPEDATAAMYRGTESEYAQQLVARTEMGPQRDFVLAGEWRRLQRDPRRLDELGGTVLADGGLVMSDGRDRVVLDDTGVEREREWRGFGWDAGHIHVPGIPEENLGHGQGHPASRSSGRLLVRTSRDDGHEELSFDGGRSFAPTRANATESFTDALVAGDDSLAARPGACDDPGRHDALCVLGAGELDAHVVALGQGLEPIAVERQHVLARDAGGRPHWVAFDGALDAVFPDTVHAVVEAAAVADGAVVAVVADADGGVQLAMASGDAIELRAMPAETRHVAFADRRRGLAWGANAGTVFRTRDGAHTWEPVPVDVDGNPAAVALGGSAATGNTLARCSAHRCIAGGRVLVVGWGDLPAAHAHDPVAPIAARVPTAANIAAAPPRWPAPSLLGSYACAVSHERPLPAFPPAPDGARIRTLIDAHGEVRLALTGQHDGPDARIAWRANDARGAFVAAPASRTLVYEEFRHPDTVTADEPARAAILALDRSHLMLSVERPSGPYSNVVDMPARGAVRIELGEAFDPVALAVGGMVLSAIDDARDFFSASRPFSSRRVDATSPASPDRGNTLLAVDGSRPGVVLATSTEAGARVFHDLERGTMRVVRGFDATHLAVCAAAPDGRGLFVRVGPAQYSAEVTVNGVGASGVWVEVAFGDGAPCVRAIEAIVPGGAFRAESATDAALHGVRYTSGIAATVRCTQ